MKRNPEQSYTTEVEAEAGVQENRNIIYTVSQTPPWYLVGILGLQQFLTAVSSTFSLPLLLSAHFCMTGDDVGVSELIGTVIFIAGLATLLQTLLGVRLPILQSISAAFLSPAISLMALPQWKCPYNDNTVNKTLLPELGSEDHKTMWKLRIAEIQGAVMIASLFQILIGASGLIAVLMKFIGPLTVAPTITMIGLSLSGLSANMAATQWWIALATMALIALFSQYLKGIKIPCATYSRDKGITAIKLPIFNLFPVLLALAISWILCLILTETGVFPEDPKGWGYRARTDIRSDVLYKTQWFRFPYPGQWGTPTISVAGVFGMFGAVLASVIESVGDYYACARLAGAPPPPGSAVGRGILIEGIGGLLAGAWGTGGGTTSYSQNIGAIGITKVGSRVVVIAAGLIMLLVGCLGKVGALFTTMPDPLVGGLFLVVFGMVTAVGISNLQFIDLRSVRNLFVLGVSMFFGISLPSWVAANRGKINTGNDIVDQLLSVLLGTHMLVAGLTAAFLDNTIPGTDEERGIIKWRHRSTSDDQGNTQETLAVYDLPFIQKYLNKLACTKYIPVCPNFIVDGKDDWLGQCCRRKAPSPDRGETNTAFKRETEVTSM